MSAARLLLAPAFGLAMALAFAAGWIALDRAFTGRTLAACSTIAASAALAAAVALVAQVLLKRQPWTVRFAAALLLLVVGTGGLTAFSLGAHNAWTTHPLPELPLRLIGIILALQSIGALYTFLSVAGYLILPLGVPLVILGAAAIAGARH